MRGNIVPIQRCSFCGRDAEHRDVDLLVASKVPGVYICQMCLGESLATLVQHRPKYWKKFVDLLRKIEPTRVAKRGSPR